MKKFVLDGQTFIAMGTCFIGIPLLYDVVIYKFITGKMLLMLIGALYLNKGIRKFQ